MEDLTGKRFTGPFGIKGRIVSEFMTENIRKVIVAFDGVPQQTFTREQVDEAIASGKFKEVIDSTWLGGAHVCSGNDCPCHRSQIPTGGEAA